MAFLWWRRYRALLQKDTVLFYRDIVPFCGNTGVMCGDIGLLCAGGDVALFCRNILFFLAEIL